MLLYIGGGRKGIQREIGSNLEKHNFECGHTTEGLLPKIQCELKCCPQESAKC